MSTPPFPRPPSCVRAVSQLSQRPIAWLWPSHLAQGKLAMLDGDPDETARVAEDLYRAVCPCWRSQCLRFAYIPGGTRRRPGGGNL
jgi:hypothetical protein